jgi:hypothetical protein
MRLAEVAVGRGRADAEREATRDDRVAAVETVLDVEQVHRTAAPARAALDLAEHLGHHRRGGVPLARA